MGEIAGGIATAGVAVWLIALSACDIRSRRLPNTLTLPGAAVILVVAAGTGHGLAAVAGAAALFGVYLTVHLIAPAALGAGDVKLALGLGALTGVYGADVWVLAALGASLTTGVLALCRRLRGVRSTVPHGPSMCLAAGLVVGLAATV